MKYQDKKNPLYFDDDEIITGKTENKKVFVTKRINGKETHVKQEKQKNDEGPKETEYKRVPNTQGFNFEREIVIDVNNKPSKNNKSFNKPNGIDNKNTNIKSKGKHSKNVKKKKPEKLKKTRNNKVSSKQKKNINTDFYENFDHNKKKKKLRNKSKSNKIMLTTISLFSLIIAMMIMALVTPVFNIQEIRVKGNDKVTTANIINLSRLKIGQNIFKNSKEKIKTYICENPYIDDVEIKRVLPKTIDLTIKERKPEYQVKLISSYVLIDSKGNILENTETKGDVIFLDGIETSQEELINEKTLKDTDIRKLTQIEKIKEVFLEIEGLDLSEIKINIKNDKDYIVYLKSENKKINIGDSSNLSNKMLYIKKILENEKENSGTIFINGDLNDGFKPYFREEEYKE